MKLRTVSAVSFLLTAAGLAGWVWWRQFPTDMTPRWDRSGCDCGTRSLYHPASCGIYPPHHP